MNRSVVVIITMEWKLFHSLMTMIITFKRTCEPYIIIVITSNVRTQRGCSAEVRVKVCCQNKMTTQDERLAETVRRFPCLYKENIPEFKDKHKKEQAWSSVAQTLSLKSGRCPKKNFIFSLVK